MLKVLSRVYQSEMKILSVKSDAILWQVSEDGLDGEKIGVVLTNLYPRLKQSYLNSCLGETLKKGKILFYNEVTPPIIVAPFKSGCIGGYDDDYILEFIKKVNSVKDRIKLNVLSIERSKLTEKQIDILKKNKTFKVKLFNKTEFLQEI